MKEEIVKTLAAEALVVRDNAYAPYSQYHVGAAVISEKGIIYRGVNVENSSYGGTVCAERNAIFAAVTAEGTSMRLAGVAVATSSSPPAAPCGLCLQVIAEFCEDEMPVFLVNDRNEITQKKFGDLLPVSFRPHMLKKS
ncbi:cytidine deaminase [Myxococcota bacterium]|nr:cytidine deaminase [Myxococcota bacterium]MBU1379356.1 cytidine deaminase [Myxococcota bacterium]MBU1497040.1 cytidine deaminase [Myxococcota bacterium]